jgi:hypothetical protein
LAKTCSYHFLLKRPHVASLSRLDLEDVRVLLRLSSGAQGQCAVPRQTDRGRGRKGKDIREGVDMPVISQQHSKLAKK